MKLDANIIRLVCELEYIIGSQCYNPNSYNGYTGEEGCGFRYPVYYQDNPEDKELDRTKWKVGSGSLSLNKCIIDTMKYKFGSNHLFIGDGLVEVLEALEKRYGIDFNELEKQRNEK